MKWLRRLSLLLLVLLVVLWLSPAQPVLVKAMLLGPNVLVPQEPPHTLTLVERGPRGERVARAVVRLGAVLRGWITIPALRERRERYLIYLPPGYADPANAGAIPRCTCCTAHPASRATGPMAPTSICWPTSSSRRGRYARSSW